MLTLSRMKNRTVTLIGIYSYQGTWGQTVEEPVWAFKIGRHETLHC